MNNEEWCKKNCPYNTDCACDGVCNFVLSLLKEQEEEIENLKQTAQSMIEGVCLLKEREAKTGKWIEQTDYIGDTYYDCSVCNESWITIEGTPWENDMNYCPHCGAKMEGRQSGNEGNNHRI